MSPECPNREPRKAHHARTSCASMSKLKRSRSASMSFGSSLGGTQQKPSNSPRDGSYCSRRKLHGRYARRTGARTGTIQDRSPVGA
jgi:hypothetical protein